MRALILAAGFGTRLGALSGERPKPLFPVCDIPLIRYAVALLRGHGVQEIAVNLHHHGDLIESELGTGMGDGTAFTYSREEVILGTGGGIRKIADFLTQGGREPFFVVNGKILVDADLDEMVRRHREHDAAATMLLKEAPDARKWGAIEVDDSGRVSKILDTGTSGAHVCMFTGVHLISPRLVERLPTQGESDSIRQAYIPALVAGERVEGVLHRGYFQEHSTPARYLAGNLNALFGRAKLRHPPGPFTGVAEDARVAHEVQVSPYSRISSGAEIAAGARIGDGVVVGRGAVVGPRAALERVILWPGAHINEPLGDAIVTPRGVHEVQAEGVNDG